MQLECDPDKRARTLTERGLDCEDAHEVFAGPMRSAPDTRMDYGEPRITTFGMLQGRMVCLVWTPRGAPHHLHEVRQ